MFTRNEAVLARLHQRLKHPLSSFWVLQFFGWALYGVLIYVTFLTVVPPSGRFSLLQVKVSRTVTGFVLTCLMRLVYKYVATNRSVPFIASLILVNSFLFGSLCPFGERLRSWLMNLHAF